MVSSAEVTVIQRSLRRYRLPFYEALRDELSSHGVRLRLIHGDNPELETRGDPGRLAWAEWRPSRYVLWRGRDFTWEPALRAVSHSDLVVVEQASSHLLNYALMARQLLNRQRVAFWGHGRNFSTDARSSAGESLKRWMSRRVHWWFAYNVETARIVEELGYPVERITVVQNSTDTRRLAELVDSVPPEEVARARAELGLRGTNVAVFVGALSAPKRFPLLVEAADLVRASVPDFELVVIGRGEEERCLRERAASRPWMIVAGHRFEDDLAPYLRMAKLLLVPGWVGLVAVDSFAAGLPLVTMRSSLHPPEVAYLEDGRNGVVVDPAGRPEAAAYADEVVRLLSDDDARARLAAGAREARHEFSVEQMAVRFREGILGALAAPGRTRGLGRS
jgi:glycosyltransferase involved in cell wall biosynthesis